MGGSTEANLDRLRRMAHHVEIAADETNELVWSTDHLGDAMPGSTVARIGFGVQTMAHADALVADMAAWVVNCLLYTSPSPRDGLLSRMPSSA